MYDEKFEFIAHECSKDGLTWNYGCKYRLTPKVKCPAKAKLTSYENSWILKYIDEDHKCQPDKAKVSAEVYKEKMKDIVRSNPTQAVGKAVIGNSEY